MEFQVQMVHEQADIAALVRVLNFRRQPDPKLRRARTIGYLIFGVVFIIMAVVSIVSMVMAGLVAIPPIVVGIITFLCGVILLRRVDSKGMEKRSWKRYPNKGMTVTYTFTRDHFEEEDEVSGKHEFPYISITSANEDEGHFFLFTAQNQGHMLRKDSFVTGDPAAFPAFIRKHCAVRIDPVE